tara:strand:+ start:772 stop:948 length:177 start_codon:yes stop_codon:yes gene_type:complete
MVLGSLVSVDTSKIDGETIIFLVSTISLKGLTILIFVDFVNIYPFTPNTNKSLDYDFL